MAHAKHPRLSFPMCRIRRLQGLSKSIKEREEKEMEEKKMERVNKEEEKMERVNKEEKKTKRVNKEEKKMERVNKEEEEMNEVDSPQFSLRPGRGFRPSTKREQIRMKLQQSKKKV